MAQMAAPRRLTKPQRITPTVEEVVRLIEDGEYDTDLRLIARACFGRREVLTGTPHVIPDNVTPDSELSTAPAGSNGGTKRRVRRPPISNSASGLPLNNMQKMYDHLVAQPTTHRKISPLDKYQRTDEETFMYKDRKFLKSDLIGKVIQFPLDTPKALRGTLVGIVGVGPYKIKLLLVSKPTTQQGNYMNHYQNREPIWFSKNEIMERISTGV